MEEKNDKIHLPTDGDENGELHIWEGLRPSEELVAEGLTEDDAIEREHDKEMEAEAINLEREEQNFNNPTY